MATKKIIEISISKIIDQVFIITGYVALTATNKHKIWNSFMK